MTATANQIDGDTRGHGSVAAPGALARVLEACRIGPVAAALVLLCAAAGDLRAAPAPRTMDLAYKVYAGGLVVADTEFRVRFHSGRFDARFTMEPRGIPALLKKFSLRSRAAGLTARHRVEPSRFRTEYWKKDRKHRWVRIDYRDATGSGIEAVPAPEKDKRADVPESLRRGALDPISAALVLSDRVGRAGRCEAALDIYDGRRFFRVGLEHLAWVQVDGASGVSYRGPALKCRMRMEKVTGFNDKELEKGRYPETATVVAAQVVPGGPWLPVRLEADHVLGRMVVRLVSVEGRGFGPQRASR